MGGGFCVLVDTSKASLVLSILEQHGRKAWVIGEVTEDPKKGVCLPRHGLVGHKKHMASPCGGSPDRSCCRPYKGAATADP
jgi:hydrogenase maturation factor